MATIRKITPSQGISDFRQMRQEGGGGFRALAGALDVAYDYLLPAAIDEATKKGDALGREISKGQIGDPQAAVVQSTMNGPAVEHDHASHRGVSHEDWLRYSNGGATRNDPLNPKLVDAMSFVKDMGITMDVVSGGQEAAGTPGAKRTGSTRHDHGNSADVDFYKDGRKLDWNNPADLPVLQEVVKGAKSRGVTGIGAGDDYMGPGRFHVGFGAPAVWGAGGKGENAPAWLREAYDGVEQGTYAGQPASVTASSSGPVEAPTVMRGADGKLTSRLFGPTSNPIMAAHDAAAGVAYQSDVFLKAGQDFMGMSEQFAMNPEGFKQAADEYVKAMVESAPEPFRMDIRSKLENEASRRFLGLVDEKHSNIRQRAANSSAALSEMWADDLASAIASGNPEEIEAARTELGSVLAARERLPGSTWTPEQSANYMRKAEEAGQASIKKAQADRAKEDGVAFDTSLTAARAGMVGEAEGRLLSDPTYAALYPEKVAELRAWTAFRDLAPTFDALSLDEQDALVSQAFEGEVTAGYEVDITKALAARAKSNRTARNAEVEIGNTMAELRDPTFAWNPYDGEQQGRVNDAYVAMIGDNAPLSDEGLAAASTIAERTGVAPKAMVDAMRASIMSGDPVSLARAMEFGGQMTRNFPNAFGVHSGTSEITDALADYSFLGRYMSSEEAALAMALEKTPEAIERRERMATTITAKAKLLKTDDIVDHFSDKFGVDVDVGSGDASAELMSEYQELFERAFISTGNADLAKNRALESISRVYGPSGINGSERIMRYPPVSFYPARDGSHDWMRSQLERDVSEFANGTIIPEGEDTENWMGFNKSGIIDADRVMLVSDASTQADIAAGRMPSYSVQFMDDDDTIQLVPGRYRFDIPAEQSGDKERFDAERAKLTGKSNLLAWKEHLRQDPNRSMTLSDIDRLLGENRDEYMAAPPPGWQ